MSCGEDLRCGSGPRLLWLWHRPAPAAPIQPLAWELPYATGVTLKSKKRKKIEANIITTWEAFKNPVAQVINCDLIP